MATNGPEQSNLPLPKSPRQLPALPRSQQTPIAEQSSPGHGQSLAKSPGTPLVFEFPPECYLETPNTNFDFDEFGRAGNSEHEQQRSARSPRSPSYYTRASPRSPKTPNSEMLHSPSRKSPIFQFCEPRKNHATSYPANLSMNDCRSVNSPGYGQRSPNRRRNSCGLTSPTIVMSSTHDATSPQTGRSLDSDMPVHYRDTAVYKGKDTGKTSSLDDTVVMMQERIVEGISERTRGTKIDRHLNRSQGCLDEAGRSHRRGSNGRSRHWRDEKNMARRSTSDLTDMSDVDTEITPLSSPRRRGSMKGGLAYLASRRNSRDNQYFSGSNEDVGPLNFSGHPRGQQRRTSNFLELPVPRHLKPRSSSLPGKPYNPRDNDDLYRLREFNITHKGAIVNKRDIITTRGSRSNTPANSSRNSNVSGERSPFEGSCCSGQGASSDSDIAEISKYRVVLLGDSGVGKTALVSQCMTSEYINTYDASLDDEFGEKTVSVLLDGEESDMVFIDHPYVEMSVENSLSTYEPHACIVVYSIVSRPSFQVAEEILNYLWRENYTQERSVIVVGNKSDLARSRNISTNEGKQLATSRECKFIETSSGMKHNVDELLVGVLKQIRLKESRDKKLRRQGSKGKLLSKLHNNKTVLSLNLAREILNKICLNDGKSKSCENLHVL